VPSKDNEAEVRAVVTDFGLAHTSGGDRSVVLSVTGTERPSARRRIWRPNNSAPKKRRRRQTSTRSAW
jgi:hypothetical protein